MSIFQPSNQIKLVNVAVVRLRKGGKRFELACYPNTILDYRRNLIKTLDDVLQIPNIFVNVSKGQVASKQDLVKGFGTDERDKIIDEILRKGEVQVGEKERARKQEDVWNEMVTIITEKCVDPNTKRPYTASVIDKVLRDMGYSVNLSKSSKQQALEAIKQIQERTALPIQRARMRLRVVMPAKDGKRIKEALLKCVDHVEDEDWGDDYDMTCVVDPGQFRVLMELVQRETKGKGRIETLSLSEMIDKDEILS